MQADTYFKDNDSTTLVGLLKKSFF